MPIEDGAEDSEEEVDEEDEEEIEEHLLSTFKKATKEKESENVVPPVESDTEDVPVITERKPRKRKITEPKEGKKKKEKLSE